MRHRFRDRWRHFAPRRNRRLRPYRRRDVSLDYKHTYEPQPVQFVCNSTDFFDCAEEDVVSYLQRRPEIHALDGRIDALRARFEKTWLAHDGMVALLAQVPRAVLAQMQMDRFEHGYRNKKERLYELIDFNDTLVSLVLVMDDSLRCQLDERGKQAADRICLRVGAPCFSNEQWRAIIRGLTREVAVFLAAKEQGFRVLMTDRAHDALGIDMQVQDPEDGRYINIDVKTPSSFRHRMEELVREGRLSERELYEGDQQSYIIEHNGHGLARAEVVVLCILPDLFGDLADWRFVDPDPMRHKLNQLIRDHGQTDGKFGRLAKLN